MKITQLLIFILVIVYTNSFTFTKNTTPLTLSFSNQTGLFVKHINPSAPKIANGQINFPTVISVSPSKVLSSAIQTAYVTVQVQQDADGPVWLGTGCALIVPYKTTDPQWYMAKYAELGMDNVYVRQEHGIRTSKVLIRVKDFFQQGVKKYSVGSQVFWLDGFYGNWVMGLGDVFWEMTVEIV